MPHDRLLLYGYRALTAIAFSLAIATAVAAEPATARFAVIVSANAEWRVVKQRYPKATYLKSPYGEYFVDGGAVFVHGGWGKISAAGSAEWVISRFSPSLIVNLGTCGGFEGAIGRGEIVLANKTIVYDIVEQMGDPQEAINAYSTAIDLAWLRGPRPIPVRETTLVSADRDILAGDVERLRKQYGAAAGDWESGAIAYVARRNGVRVLILRGVTDLVNPKGGEAYGNPDVFVRATQGVMTKLLDSLPAWLKLAAKP